MTNGRSMRNMVVGIVEWNARRRLVKSPNLSIGPNAELRYRNLRLGTASRLSVGEGSIIEGRIAFERDGAEVSIGRNTFFGASHIVCAERVEIGDDVQISWGCTIIDSDLHSLNWAKRQKDAHDWWHLGRKDWTDVECAPIRLGNKCWLGLHCIVLKGVEIGEGAVVAAGSVVTKSVPAWTVAGGNPARVIREIPPEER